MSSSMIALHLSVCRLTDTVIGYEYAAFLHGSCLLFAVWDLQLATLEKSNPMYNTHPKVQDNIIEKKVRIISEILRYTRTAFV